ncbi:MAG: hypothetical protein IKR52_08830 [Paludibacteraceae bacterium]|nr:hypothetical protein [Paludibacteraceae bacterium]
MAKHTKEELLEIKKQTKELLNLLLKKTGAKHSEIVEMAEQRFIIANLDELSASEKRKFNKLVF